MRQPQTQRVPVPIVGPSGAVRSKDVSAAETVNLFPEINADSTEPMALVGCSGYQQFRSLTGDGHGLAVLNGGLFAFVGESVYQVYSGGVATSRGTIPGMGRVRAVSNGSQLAISSRGTFSGYLADPGAVNEIDDEDLDDVSDVTFLNQRFVWLNEDTGRFQWSDLLGGGSYDALNFATAEGQPDDATAILSDGRQLFVGGEKTIETFYDDGTGFTRTPQGVATKGVAARDSFIMFDNAPTFLGASVNGGLSVYRLADGFNVQRISTNAVDTAMSGYDNPAEAFAFTFFEDGHDYYVLTFPGQGTWVYDAATLVWHQRRTYGQDDWSVVDVRSIYGKTLGLLDTGDIVEIRSDLYQESGTTIERLRVTPPFSFNGRRFSVYRLELECETGGSASTSALSMEMSISRDRGRTWGDWKAASIGRQGDYSARVFWTQLGSFRDVVLRFRQTDNAAATWLRAFADVEVHAS